jgi:hypothetical protein
VDIDVEAARILVAVQKLSEDGRGYIEEELDDTERALMAIQTVQPLETR